MSLTPFPNRPADAAALARRVAALEYEQTVLAGELHDELAQLLSAAAMHLECAGPSAKENVELAAAQRNVHAALAEVRRLISGLRPPLLEEAGLSGAIAWLVEDARRDIPQMELIDGLAGAKFPAAVELAAFRIAQEALANARHHSRAERAEVQLARKPDSIELVVRDWGTGFDAAALRPGRFGLAGIRQRAALLAGEATINSTLGEGTTVRVELPLAQDES